MAETILSLRDLQVGASLPERTFGPITRTTLALFAAGSGDHNPIHLDSDFAQSAGAPDVFAHGMLSMAYLARYMLGFAPQSALLSWSVRFLAITPVNSSVICSGAVAARTGDAITLKIGARTTGGLETLAGEAIVAAD